MEAKKEKNWIKLFQEAYKYPGLIADLSEYELQKLNPIIDSRISGLTDRIVDIIINNPGYKYPDGTDETKLFEYWATHTNAGEYYKLQKFKNQLSDELNKRNEGAEKTLNPSISLTRLKDPSDVAKEYVGRPRYNPPGGGLPVSVITEVMAATRDFIRHHEVKSMYDHINTVATGCEHLMGARSTHRKISEYYSKANGRYHKPEEKRETDKSTKV